MKLTVLVDNNSLIDKYYYAEPALSFFIEADGKKILFDAGYSDLFIKNAEKLGIDLTETDIVALSHGHNDHTWGLNHLIQYYDVMSLIKENKMIKPDLVAHPFTFLPKKIGRSTVIGNILSDSVLSECFNLKLTSEVIKITDNLFFLGEIDRNNDFEAKKPVGRFYKDGSWKPDFILDDSALVYKSEKGLHIITGCSHAGICNIVEYAKKVCGENRIVSIIGGFHLLEPSKKQLDGTLKYLKESGVEKVFACHCTDLKSKIELSKVVNIVELGSGVCIEFNS